MNTRIALIIAAGIFLAVLATQIANRMTTDAINVAVGALCGMVASVPVSFGLLLALQRRQEQSAVEQSVPVNDDEPGPYPELPYAPSFAQYQQPQQRMPYPQVIVVAPPQSGYGSPYAQSPNMNYPQLGDGMQERNWKIVGEGEE